MGEDWDDQAGGWDDNDDVRAYAAQAFATLSEHVPPPGQGYRRVLDFGCGTGLLTEKLAPVAEDIVAIDTSQKMIDVLHAKQIGNVTAICGEIAEIAASSSKFGERKFNLIVASSVCGFLADYEATLGTLAGFLCPGGHFVQWDWMASASEPSGLTLDRVSDAITGAGMLCDHVGEAFAFGGPEQRMPVLIGVGSLR